MLITKYTPHVLTVPDKVGQFFLSIFLSFYLLTKWLMRDYFYMEQIVLKSKKRHEKRVIVSTEF